MIQPRVAGGSPGWQVAGRIFGSQVSALRSQVRVIRYRYGCGKFQILNLYPNLNT